MSSPVQLRLPGLAADLVPVFAAVHLQLKPRTPLPEIRAEFFPFAGLNHTARFREGRLLVRVSDIFTDAPETILRSVAVILLAKLYRKKVDHTIHRSYRSFILQSDIQERARAARFERGKAQPGLGMHGRYADLEACFDRLNREYFDGTLNTPRISWTAKRSRRILGRYDSTHHTIFISRFFDSPDVPALALDYVMFHEMLHVKHQSRIEDCRIMVHTREFKADERRFAHYRTARAWLKGI